MRKIRLFIIAITTVMAALLLTAGARSASAAPPSYKLVVYTTYSSSSSSSSSSSVGNTGHVMVQLIDNTTIPAGNFVYGKYPAGNWVFNTNGVINDDSNRVWSWRVTYTLTQAQFNAAKAYADAQKANPNAYKLLSTNCVEFAEQVVAAAGQTMPSDKDSWGIPDPATVASTLSASGNGSTLNGGTVANNPTNTTVSGAPDPLGPEPDCCDVSGIGTATLTDPSSTATGMQFQLSDTLLPLDDLNPDNSYSVSIHSDPTLDYYAVDWGDGNTEIDANLTADSSGNVHISHTYGSPPANNLRVFDIGDAQITEWDRPLQASNSTTGHGETDTEPAPPSQTIYGPGTGLPEMPWPALAPITAVGVGGLALVMRRRRRNLTPAA